MTAIALLGSVFLPLRAAEPLAAELTRRRHRVRAVAPAGEGSPADVLRAYENGCRALHAPVVIAHSNAGLYIPALAAAGLVETAVFMDAVVPEPGGAVPLVPGAMRDELAALAVDGLLPPWTRWWPAEDLAPLFPSPAAQAEIDHAAPHVPVSYIEGSIDVPAGWTARLSGAFLGLSDAYPDDRARAASLGWPTDTLDLGHLGHLLDPVRVATHLDALLARAT